MKLPRLQLRRPLPLLLAVTAAFGCGEDALTGPDPRLGAVRGVVETTGQQLDPDGYRITAEGEQGDAAIQDTVLLTGLEPGDYSVELSAVAANCSVAGDNPRSVTVVAGDTADVRFDISCVATEGTVRVITSTAGAEPDPDGYTVAVGDGSGTAVAADDTLDVTTEPGEVSVQLSGVAGNCSVSGANPRAITVVAGDTAGTTFAVSCPGTGSGGDGGGDGGDGGDDGGGGGTSGSIRVVTSTTGSDQDPDGYSFTVDGGSGTAIARNDTVYVGGLAAGDHDVALGGVAGNCSVGGANPRTVTVAAGDTAEAAFDVSCTATSASARIVYGRTADGFELWSVGLDGSDRRQITDPPAGSSDNHPDYSPDGSRIVFATDRDDNGGENAEVYVVNADGTGVSNLTNAAGRDVLPAWNPAGGSIAWNSDRDGSTDIWVMNEDGSGQVNRTPGSAGTDEYPAWTPDGSRIVFSTDRDGNFEIYVMDADGSNPLRLTNDPARDETPSVSPDGSKIAFTSRRDGNDEIYVMGIDGSGLVRLTNDPAVDEQPVWTSDGRIAFTSNRSGRDIYIMDADGSDVQPLTTRPGADEHPGATR